MGLSIFGHGNNGTAQWVDDPSNGRGTRTILVNCIITLTLCVYTSLHLNIPAHGSGVTKTIGTKIKYVVFGLLAPELIVFNAWRQMTVAKSLVRRLRKERGGKEVPSSWQRMLSGIAKVPAKTRRGIDWCIRTLMRRPRPKPPEMLPMVANKDPWGELTLVHGYYIVMGGFTFDISKDHRPRIWHEKVDRLTPNVMTVLACLISRDRGIRDVLPWLTEEEIWDKSKANGLAKTIVCIQATWFCAQCIARLAEKLPISLLELNTFAHAVCALLVYILWWSKPLDVHEPTVVDVSQSDVARSICAMAWSGLQGPVPHLKRVSASKGTFEERLRHEIGLILQGSQISNLGDGPLIDPDSQKAPATRLVAAKVAGLKRPTFLTDRPTRFEGLDAESLNSRIWACTEPPVFTVDGVATLPTTDLKISAEWTSVDVDEILLARLKVMESLRQAPNYAAYDTAFSNIVKATDPDLRMLKPRELNFTDSLMRQSADIKSVGRNFTGALGIMLSGFFYGGLHLIAWGSNTFTSPLEDLAWKISCFVVAGSGLFTFTGIFALELATKRMKAKTSVAFFKWLGYLGAPFYVAFAAFYLVCRVYLVFEVVRNLAYLDPAVYQTPKWPIYIPHIS